MFTNTAYSLRLGCGWQPVIGFVYIILLLASCQKEPGLTGTTNPPTDSCYLQRLEQGAADTVLTLFYDSKGRVFKITDYYGHSNETDSIIATFDVNDHIIHLSYQSPGPAEFSYEYNGDELIKAKMTDYYAQYDSVVYTYEYNAGNGKPSRKNWLIYPASMPGGLAEYYTFEYNAAGDITTKTTYNPDGSLWETSKFTYTSQPNSFHLLGLYGEITNFYDAEGSQFYEAWWNTHDLATMIRKDWNGNILDQKKLHYDLDSTGSVTGMQSDRYHDVPGDGAMYHYSFFYHCP